MHTGFPELYHSKALCLPECPHLFPAYLLLLRFTLATTTLPSPVSRPSHTQGGLWWCTMTWPIQSCPTWWCQQDSRNTDEWWTSTPPATLSKATKPSDRPAQGGGASPGPVIVFSSSLLSLLSLVTLCLSRAFVSCSTEGYLPFSSTFRSTTIGVLSMLSD